MANVFITGTVAAFSKTILAPIDRTKMILQNQECSLQVMTHKRKKYKNAFDVIRRIPEEQVRADCKLQNDQLFICFRVYTVIGEAIW